MGLSHEAQWCTPTALAVKSAHDAVEVKEPEHRVVGSAAKSSPRRSQALMRSSRKQVASASHAVPEVRFADHDLTSFGGLVVLQGFLLGTKFAARLRQSLRHLESSTAYSCSKLVLLPPSGSVVVASTSERTEGPLPTRSVGRARSSLPT